MIRTLGLAAFVAGFAAAPIPPRPAEAQPQQVVYYRLPVAPPKRHFIKASANGRRKVAQAAAPAEPKAKEAVPRCSVNCRGTPGIASQSWGFDFTSENKSLARIKLATLQMPDSIREFVALSIDGLADDGLLEVASNGYLAHNDPAQTTTVNISVRRVHINADELSKSQ